MSGERVGEDQTLRLSPVGWSAPKTGSRGCVASQSFPRRGIPWAPLNECPKRQLSSHTPCLTRDTHAAVRKRSDHWPEGLSHHQNWELGAGCSPVAPKTRYGIFARPIPPGPSPRLPFLNQALLRFLLQTILSKRLQTSEADLTLSSMRVLCSSVSFPVKGRGLCE